MGIVPSKPPKNPPAGYYRYSELESREDRRLGEIERRVRRAESRSRSDYGMDLLKIGFWTGLFR